MTQDWLIWFVLALQWCTVWVAFREKRKHFASRFRLHSELADTWGVLIECVKTLQQHDDFQSQHVLKLIDELGQKYPADRFGKLQ